MLPKVEVRSGCNNEGVRKVHIVDGRIQHAVLLELFTDEGIGTEVI